MSRSVRDVLPLHRRPEKDLEHPPGQIVNPIPGAKYLRDVIQRIDEQEREVQGPKCDCGQTGRSNGYDGEWYCPSCQTSWYQST